MIWPEDCGRLFSFIFVKRERYYFGKSWTSVKELRMVFSPQSAWFTFPENRLLVSEAAIKVDVTRERAYHILHTTYMLHLVAIIKKSDDTHTVHTQHIDTADRQGRQQFRRPDLPERLSDSTLESL
jgi:hypothetical protein